MILLDCVFCDVSQISSEIEEHYAADGSSILVFEPLNPVVPGHVLVVPRVHVSDFAEDPYVSAMTASVAARVAARHRSLNVITSVGVPATQSVFHLNMHVVPRVLGDNLGLPWAPPNVSRPSTGAGHTTPKEHTMALTKHGEGSLLPEDDDQKKTAAHNPVMTEEMAKRLNEENEQADR